MKTLVIGCGYVGLPLALRLKSAGDEIAAWVRSQESADALGKHRFREIIVGSVADAALWKKLAPFDRLIHCASSGRGGVEAYREVFLEGARAMGAHQPQARRLLVSSTSVYGQTGGEIVTEESPAEPATETGKILREAEMVALAAGAVVARSAGIYGPGRGVLFEKLRRGEAVIEGDGSRWINQVHRDDLVAALVLLSERGKAGQICNVCDNVPTPQRIFCEWASSFLNQPMPPGGPVNPRRKRGLSSKRVSNEKLRGLGWEPKFPSFLEGFTAIYSPR